MTTTRAVIAALHARGFRLGAPPAPAGAYLPVVALGGIGMVSGQFPFRDGSLAFMGRVGEELTEEEGRAAARLSAVNVLSQLNTTFGGFESLLGLLRVDGYIASAECWTGQAKVLDAASELLVDVLGERGRHARSAIAVPRLPLNAPVELVVSFISDSEDRPLPSAPL